MTDKPPTKETAATKPRRTAGGAPALLGGIGAAAIGFIVAQVVPDGWPIKDNSARFTATEEAIAGQAAEVAAVKEALSAQGVVADEANAAMAAQIAELQNRQAEQLAAMAEQTAALEVRLSDLEKRPTEGDGASEAAIQAFNRDVEALRQMIEAQQAEIAALAEAPPLAQSAALDLALRELDAAILSGSGFAEPLSRISELTGSDAPEVLHQNSTGITSLTTLRDSFPDAARAALAASTLSASEGEERSGFGAFLRQQLGLRSLEPQEGGSTDAILSRIEAALKADDYPIAATEIQSLSPEAIAAMSDWIGQFQTTHDVLTAAQALRDTTQNQQD